MDYLKSTIFRVLVALLIILIFYNVQFNNPPAKEITIYQKYVTSSFEHPSALGNMLFRFASLYGIARDLGRLPYVNGSIPDQLKGLTEMSEYFPGLHETIQVKVPYEALVTNVNFTDHCCIYESPENLTKYGNAQYLKLSANYLQSYKFFHKYHDDISKVMECSDNFKIKSNSIAEKFWGKDSKSSHKMCVHVRRGDFVTEWPLETRADFTLPAVKYIHEQLKIDERNRNISLLLLGNDEVFMDNLSTLLNLNFQSTNNLFAFNTTRSFDMCFGIEHCDSLLLSASSSTYGWWIGYLMKSQGPVYYNAIVTKIGSHAKDHFDYDLFPPAWKKLLLQKDGTVKIETKWTTERNMIKELQEKKKKNSKEC